MNISKKNQEKVNILFENNSEMKEKLYKGDAEAIREIGIISQRGINPDEIIAAYESDDPSAMDNLYQNAKRLVELQKLYKVLCLEYYKKMKDTIYNYSTDATQRSITPVVGYPQLDILEEEQED